MLFVYENLEAEGNCCTRILRFFCGEEMIVYRHYGFIINIAVNKSKFIFLCKGVSVGRFYVQ